MATQDLPGGVYRVADLELTRVGYGAMQLAGPGVFGPPKDRDAAIAVLRTAVDLGIRHIDTADFYGPHVTNEIIREALAPYGVGLLDGVSVRGLRARRQEVEQCIGHRARRFFGLMVAGIDDPVAKRVV